MTEQEAGAIQIAYEHLTKEPTWKQGSPEYEKAWSWEKLIVLSSVRPEKIIQQDGVSLVHDNEGRLVPSIGRLLDWHFLYDDTKGETLIVKAARGHQIAHKVL